MLNGESGFLSGTVTAVSRDRGFGSIRCDSGDRVPFRMSAVLAYDADALEVGRAVMFDLTADKHPVAINISLLRTAGGDAIRPKPEPECIRYLGFEQIGPKRTWRFEVRGGGFDRGGFSVTADLAQLANRQVHVQDGPALCLGWLKNHLSAGGAGGLTHLLSDEDIAAHVAAPPPPRRSGGRSERPHRKPGT